MRKIVLALLYGTLVAVFVWALWNLGPAGRAEMLEHMWTSLIAVAIFMVVIMLPLFGLGWWIDRRQPQPPAVRTADRSCLTRAKHPWAKIAPQGHPSIRLEHMILQEASTPARVRAGGDFFAETRCRLSTPPIYLYLTFVRSYKSMVNFFLVVCFCGNMVTAVDEVKKRPGAIGAPGWFRCLPTG